MQNDDIGCISGRMESISDNMHITWDETAKNTVK